MPAARLAEVRAAFGLRECDDSAEAREELFQHVLAGKSEWRADLLAAHRERVGSWRDVHKRQKGGARRAPAAAAASSSGVTAGGGAASSGASAAGAAASSRAEQ